MKDEESRMHQQQLLRLQLEHQHQEEDKQADLKRAKFLLREAMEEDEKNNWEDALCLYLDAAELCIKAVCICCMFVLRTS